MKIKLNIRDLNQDNTAVVGIIVTVLLIGLFLSILVMLNTVYVPQWLEESEAAHMEEISNQFAQLKYALDIQSVVNDSTAISSSVTLGTKEIPFFDKGRTFDTLRIVDIKGFDKQADGGCHVKSLNEIGRLKFKEAVNKGKQNRRVYFTVEQ